MSSADGYEIAWQLAQAFEQLGVEYFLGGSMASSLQGPSRFTNDIDFVARQGGRRRFALSFRPSTLDVDPARISAYR